MTAYVLTTSELDPTLARVVRAVADQDPTATIRQLSETTTDSPYTALRRGLYGGPWR
jgi:hypothetical protein